MKAILEFDLGEYSDRLAHKRCTSAADAYLALYELREMFFRMSKDESKVDAEKLKQEFFDILEANSINLNDLE